MAYDDLSTIQSLLSRGSSTTDNLQNITNRAISGKSAYRAKMDRLAERTKSKAQKIMASGVDLWDDGDSSKYFRIEGIDTPETFHEQDLHNEQTKMLKQYAYLHPELTPQQAYEEALGQKEAYKIAAEQGQNLGQMITDYRADGIMDEDYAPTAFDIYQAGDEASRFAKRDAITNPETSRDASGNFATGKTGHFNRIMADNKEYAKRVVGEGYAAPGYTDKGKYAQQLEQVEKARKEKLGNYSTPAGAKVMDAIIATSYANKKFEGKLGTKSTADEAHYENPEEFTKQVGYKIANEQVVRDPKTGKFYQDITHPDGTVVTEEVPADEISSMYVAGNKPGGSTKLGVARADLKPEMWEEYGEHAPMIARYMDKRGYNPYLGAYKPKEGEINPETGEPALGYDGTPGPEGINVFDPNAAVLYMRTGAVEDLEKFIHTHAGQVESRTAGSDVLLRGDVSKGYDERFGAGTSEYTISEGPNAAPLWNDQYNMDEISNITPELMAEPSPTKSKQWDKVHAIQKEDPTRNIVASDLDDPAGVDKYDYKSFNFKRPSDNSVTGRLSNAAASAGATIAGAGYGILDAASELLGYATGGYVGGDLATSEEITEWSNSLTGYDDSYTAEAGEKIKASFNNWREGKISFTEFIAEGGIAGLKAAPEAAASSLAFVATLFAPGKALQGVTKLGKAINASTKGMNAADKAKQVKLIKDSASTLNKITHAVAGQAGFMAASATSTSDDMDAYKEATGTDMSVLRTMGSASINMMLHNLDGIIDKGIITKAGMFTPDVMKLIKESSSGAKMKLVQGLSAKGMGVAADTVLKEMPTEIIQAGMEAFSKKYGTKDADGNEHTISSILTDKEVVEEMVVSAMMTPGSVAGMKAYGAAASVPGKVYDKVKSSETVKKVKDKVNAAKEQFPGVDSDKIAAAGASLHQAGKDTVNGIKETFKGDKEAGAAYIVSNPEEAASTFTAADETADEFNSPEVQTAAKGFDELYGLLTQGVNGKLQEANELRKTVAEDSGDVVDFGPQLAEAIVPHIEELQGFIAKAKAAGAGPQRIKHMQGVVNQLNTLTQLQTQDEMKAVMDSEVITPTSKATMILGSSDDAFIDSDGKTTVEAIDKAIADEGVTPVQRELLKYKREVITAADSKSATSMEKVYGKGNKKGLLEYAEELVRGTLTSTSMERLEKFAQSQVDKLQMYQDAVNTWKKANPDKSPAYEDKTTLSNGTQYSVNGAHSVIEAITKEQVYIDSLVKIAQDPNASQTTSAEPVTSRTDDIGTNTRETTTDASTATNTVSIEELINTTPSDYQIMSDDEFNTIGKRIVEAGIASSKGSKERKDLQKAYTQYAAVGKAQNRKIYTTPVQDGTNAAPKVTSVDSNILSEATQIIKDAGLDGEVGSESFNKAVETKVVELNQQKTKNYNDTVTKIANDIYASIGTENQVSTDSIIADPKNPNYEFVASNKEAVKKKVAELIGADTTSDPYTFTDKEISNMTAEQVDAELNAIESVDTLSDTQINTRDRLRAAYEQKVSEQDMEPILDRKIRIGKEKKLDSLTNPDDDTYLVNVGKTPARARIVARKDNGIVTLMSDLGLKIDLKESELVKEASTKTSENSDTKVPYTASQEAIDKSAALTDKIYKMSTTKGYDTRSDDYKNTVKELIAIADQSSSQVTSEKAQDLGKALKRDKILSIPLKRLNNLLNHLAKGKPLSKAHKNTLYELLPQVLKEQEGKAVKKYTKIGTNSQTEAVRDAAENNADIGETDVNAQGNKQRINFSATKSKEQKAAEANSKGDVEFLQTDKELEAEFNTLQQEIESIDPKYDMSDIIGPVIGPDSKSTQEQINSAKEVLKELKPIDTDNTSNSATSEYTSESSIILPTGNTVSATDVGAYLQAAVNASQQPAVTKAINEVVKDKNEVCI